jgi:GAF domain-containing protein
VLAGGIYYLLRAAPYFMTNLAYPIAENEEERLAALHATALLDSPEEEVFNCITRTAQTCFDVPIAAISLVDRNRQWFKAKCGLPVNQTARDISFCTYAILNKAPMIVSNALEDARFANNPLVLGEPNIRFYAGAPVVIPDGIILGTLCIIDNIPHYDFDESQSKTLSDLAHVTANIIELRLRAQR